MACYRLLSSRWSGRLTTSWNNAREHYLPEGLFDFIGNPTRTDTEPLVDGGQFAPASGTEGVFLNARWQVNASAAYSLSGGVDVAANVFGRRLSVCAVPTSGTRR